MTGYDKTLRTLVVLLLAHGEAWAWGGTVPLVDDAVADASPAAPAARFHFRYIKLFSERHSGSKHLEKDMLSRALREPARLLPSTRIGCGSLGTEACFRKYFNYTLGWKHAVAPPPELLSGRPSTAAAEDHLAELRADKKGRNGANFLSTAASRPQPDCSNTLFVVVRRSSLLHSFSH